MYGNNPCFAGKKIIFLNSGTPTETFILEKAKKLGCHTIVVDWDYVGPNQLADDIIIADSYNHDDVVQKLIAHFKEHPSHVPDGAVTFWEDDVTLLARVCDEFGLIGNTCCAALRTRNKYEMRCQFEACGLPSPKFRLLQDESNLEDATESLGFPAILKPVWGVDSLFVMLVHDRFEAEQAFRYLLKNCNQNHREVFKYNSGLFLYEEYVDGLEVSLEAFVQDGVPKIVAINEKQPIKLPFFIEFGDICPARLSAEDALKCSNLAESALVALGVENSLAHIEMKLTANGPVLIEVASRMGGDDLYKNVREVYNFDLIEAALLIATGQPVSYRRKPPSCYVVSKYFIPERSGLISNVSVCPSLSEREEIVDLVLAKNCGDLVDCPPVGFDHMGWVSAKGSCYREAEAHLESALDAVVFEIATEEDEPFKKVS